MVGSMERLYTLRLVAAIVVSHQDEVVVGGTPNRPSLMKADSSRHAAQDKPAVPAQPALQLGF